MSNIRRQTLIIAVLIVLIACAGWFAKTYNNTLTTNGNIGEEATDTNSQQNQEAAVFFSQARITRESDRSSTIENLQNVIQSTDASEDAKAQATSKYMKLLSRGDQENEVELKVKNDGYTDSLCFITDTGVELYVKVSDNLSKEQAFALQEVIVRTTGIAPSSIVVKPIAEK